MMPQLKARPANKRRRKLTLLPENMDDLRGRRRSQWQTIDGADEIAAMFEDEARNPEQVRYARDLRPLAELIAVQLGREGERRGEAWRKARHRPRSDVSGGTRIADPRRSVEARRPASA